MSKKCPCGELFILADTENWNTPVCSACYEAIEACDRHLLKIDDTIDDVNKRFALPFPPSERYAMSKGYVEGIKDGFLAGARWATDEKSVTHRD